MDARGGEKLERRRRPSLKGSGGMLPQKSFNFRVLETPFPAFSQDISGKFISRKMQYLIVNFSVVGTAFKGEKKACDNFISGEIGLCD